MAFLRWLVTCASAALALVGCSTLPEYAAPKGRVADIADVDLSDVISYRALVRADFKGEQPPADFAANAERVGAATCAYLITTPDTRMEVRPARAPAGEMIYVATPTHLRFRTQMDRNCSWWNPKDLGLPQGYILEHEQIHFALFELEARRLNESIQEFKSNIESTAASPEAAGQILQKRLEQQLQSRIKDILARSRRFDEETSMGHNPVQQKKWLNLVRSELSAAGY